MLSFIVLHLSALFGNDYPVDAYFWEGFCLTMHAAGRMPAAGLAGAPRVSVRPLRRALRCESTSKIEVTRRRGRAPPRGWTCGPGVAGDVPKAVQ